MDYNAKDKAALAVKAIEDKKGEAVKVIDISAISVIADYFVICNGNSLPQVDAITDNVLDSLLKEKISPKRIEGRNGSGWVLLDYGDVVVHIFNKEERLFYDLERIWRDGKYITLE